MKGRLLLVAASGLAREALSIEHLLGGYGEFTIVDDDPRQWGRVIDGATVIGGLELVPEMPDHDVLVCAGRGRARRSLVDRLTTAGVAPDRYATCVHPSVEIPRTCEVGPGSILMAGVVMTADVRIGHHVVAMPQVTLTHDDVVEDFATLCAGVSLGGSVLVRREAYLGMNASVREGLTVGIGATLGMGAALTRGLPDGQTWVGVPAARVSERSGAEPSEAGR